ncbi:unnamed protein product [Mytilus coruscus]|uniref:Reverse transcriptase domain-containing protein n=1 Tax=Mytilus coruscus TaxID=42192 RepID=A0A6J8DJK4_MYTCO|nr:unnamed protein product [Mytilus coruscus]
MKIYYIDTLYLQNMTRIQDKIFRNRYLFVCIVCHAIYITAANDIKAKIVDILWKGDNQEVLKFPPHYDLDGGKTDIFCDMYVTSFDDVNEADMQAKYNARKIHLKERAIEKENFYHQLEQNPSTKTFYKLIKRNLNTANSNTPVILHENKEIRCPEEQNEVLAKYYELLATPQNCDQYDEDYLQMCQLRCKIIKELAQESKESSIEFTKNEILTAIQNLNSGKAGDEYGLFAEHLKLAGTEVTPILKLIFDRIIKERRKPEHFKSGIITPVCKQGKDCSLLDSYRSITVSSILGKTFEHSLLNKIMEKLKNNSSQQFGFTQGLSPSMAAPLISEAQMNSKQMR